MASTYAATALEEVRTIRNGTDKFKDLFFEGANQFQILDGKKKFRKYSCLPLNKEIALCFW